MSDDKIKGTIRKDDSVFAEPDDKVIAVDGEVKGTIRKDESVFAEPGTEIAEIDQGDGTTKKLRITPDDSVFAEPGQKKIEEV